MSETGKRMIEGLTELRDVLKRGERLGAHFKISTWIPCPCCEGAGCLGCDHIGKVRLGDDGSNRKPAAGGKA